MPNPNDDVEQPIDLPPLVKMQKPEPRSYDTINTAAEVIKELGELTPCKWCRAGAHAKCTGSDMHGLNDCPCETCARLAEAGRRDGPIAVDSDLPPYRPDSVVGDFVALRRAEYWAQQAETAVEGIADSDEEEVTVEMIRDVIGLGQLAASISQSWAWIALVYQGPGDDVRSEAPTVAAEETTADVLDALQLARRDGRLDEALTDALKLFEVRTRG